MEKVAAAIVHESNDWEPKNKKAVFLMREMSCSGKNMQTKGTACAVKYYDKQSGKHAYFLVTCSEVVTQTVNQNTLCADRFCSEYPKHQDKHRVHITAVPKHKDFIFIRLKKEPDVSLTMTNLTAKHGELNFNLEGKISHVHPDCLSYSFTGTSFQTIRWKYSTEEQVHHIDKIYPEGAFDVNTGRGSPVVSRKDPCVVIGVVNCSSKEPYLMFFTESSKQASDKDTMDTGPQSHSYEGNGLNVAQNAPPPPNTNMSAKLPVQANNGPSGEPSIKQIPLNGPFKLPEDRRHSAPCIFLTKRTDDATVTHYDSELPLSLDKRKILQPGDSLAKSVTGSLELLEALGRYLDKEYGYGRIKCWKHLAEHFGVEPDVYEGFGSNSPMHSPTERLFDYLKVHQPKLTVKELKDALVSIDRQDVIQNVLFKDQPCSGCGSLSDGTLVCSLLDSKVDIIGQMACQLDRSDHGRKNWKQLSGELNVPRRDFLRFESWSDENPTEELFRFLRTSRPRMTVGDLTVHLDALSLQIAKDVIVNSRNVTEESLLSVLMEDFDVVDEVYELLNSKQPFDTRPGWKRLGNRLQIKNLEDFAPREAQRVSPTHALINHLEAAQPSLTLERFICGVYQINRNDVIDDVIRPYLPDNCLDQILRRLKLVTESKEQ